MFSSVLVALGAPTLLGIVTSYILLCLGELLQPPISTDISSSLQIIRNQKIGR